MFKMRCFVCVEQSPGIGTRRLMQIAKDHATELIPALQSYD